MVDAVAAVALVVAVLAALRHALVVSDRGDAVARLRGGDVLAPPAAGALWPRIEARCFARRIDARIDAAVPLALEAMARSLRTGGSLRQALREAVTATPAELGEDLDRLAGAVEHGAPLAGALDDWVTARPLPSVRLAAAALRLGAETGGAQARALDGVAATVRERRRAAAEVSAQATQARVSAAVIALSPLAFGVLSTASDHRTAAFLFGTIPGLALLGLGLGLDCLGAFWMARLTRVTA
jgi:tight adherence protein B